MTYLWSVYHLSFVSYELVLLMEGGGKTHTCIHTNQVDQSVSKNILQG